ncbi:lysophospholipase L1-like esterase [Sinorhizobium meliloti]|uniref:SGNH/GDSL hydrolase family protein n=1 Tax=Rhizobium meliloti TaxID=382 RepID=UPI000FD7BFE5|nr:SGNH/GDSL hydrolase family protein [Sinorhizobium meliloti]RVH19670.1 hypothetical protein CN215_28060 [Sinorhizobium meliloti]
MANEIASAFNNAWADGPVLDPYEPSKPVIRGVGQTIQTQVDLLNQEIDATAADLEGQIDEIAGVVAAGTQWVDPVAVATTANITLSGEQTIDGVATSGSRILVKNQSAPAQNGIYLTAAGAWARTSDANDPGELVGLAVFVSGGTANGGKQFICTTKAPITVGTTAITFREFSDQSALNANLAGVQAALPKKAKLPNLFTNGNLDPDGPEFTLFDELFTDQAIYTARSSGFVVIPLANTIINGLGCYYAINVPANASTVGNRGNKLTQNVNLKGGGVFFSVLVYNYAGGWDFGTSGSNGPLATLRYSDGTQNSMLLTTFESIGSNVRRYYGYQALAPDKVVTRIELGLDAPPPRGDRFGLTGFWASATTESGTTITDTEYPDWRTKRNYPTALSNRVATLETRTTAQQFVAALNDDLHSISLCLVGDSITWGRIASGNSATDPRTGELTDPRNTIDEAVSPSWANLLIGYLVRTFAQGAITSPAAGVAEARKVVIGDVCYDPRFSVQDKFTRGPRPKDVTLRTSGPPSGPLLRRHLDIPNTVTATDALVFEFTGDEFTVVHANLGGAVSATYTIEVDDVIIGDTYEHGLGNAWGFTDTISAAYGNHRVRIWNNSAAQVLRLEAIKVNRLLRVRNQGIIGRTTNSWLPTGSLYAGVLAADEFVLIMLGTNDRLTDSAQINAGVRIRDNLKTIGTELKNDGKTVILQTPPRAIPAEDWPLKSGLSFDTQEMAMAVRQAAADLGVSVIDNYAEAAVKTDGSLLNADGLHPNDAGHRAIFTNIITSLGLLGQAPA